MIRSFSFHTTEETLFRIAMSSDPSASSVVSRHWRVLPSGFYCPFTGMPDTIFLEGTHKDLLRHFLRNFIHEEGVYINMLHNGRWVEHLFPNEKEIFQKDSYPVAAKVPDAVIMLGKKAHFPMSEYLEHFRNWVAEVTKDSRRKKPSPRLIKIVDVMLHASGFKPAGPSGKGGTNYVRKEHKKKGYGKVNTSGENEDLEVAFMYVNNRAIYTVFELTRWLGTDKVGASC